MKSNLLEASKNTQTTIENLEACFDEADGLDNMVISQILLKANRLKAQIDDAYLNVKETR